MSFAYRAYGLSIHSELGLPGMEVCGPFTDPDLVLSSSSRAEVDVAWSGAAGDWRREFTLSEGVRLRSERGVAADLLFSYGDQAVMHLASDGRRLLCAAAPGPAAGWQRALLDTVLGTAGLAAGFEGLHAAAVERDGQAVAIVAGRGGGKSTLAAELMLRGATLVADDVLLLSTAGAGATVVAHSAPGLMNVAGAGVASRLGAPLATLGAETWVDVHHRYAGDAAPLAAVVFLDRRPGAHDRVAPVGSPTRLLEASLRSGPGYERLRRRLDLFGQIAEELPVIVLEADVSTASVRLAGLVDDALEQTPAPAGSRR